MPWRVEREPKPKPRTNDNCIGFIILVIVFAAMPFIGMVMGFVFQLFR